MSGDPIDLAARIGRRPGGPIGGYRARIGVEPRRRLTAGEPIDEPR